MEDLVNAAHRRPEIDPEIVQGGPHTLACGWLARREDKI
jgi:hypothetical protein